MLINHGNPPWILLIDNSIVTCLRVQLTTNLLSKEAGSIGQRCILVGCLTLSAVTDVGGRDDVPWGESGLRQYLHLITLLLLRYMFSELIRFPAKTPTQGGLLRQSGTRARVMIACES